MVLPANWTTDSSFTADDQNNVEDEVNALRVTVDGLSAGSTDPEVVRDTMAATLVEGANIDITVSDVGNTITIASTAVGGGGDTVVSSVVDFGFCQSELGNQDWFSEDEVRDTLQGIKDAGGTSVRFAAWWRGIEQTSTPGAYTWTGTDRALNLIEEYGLRPLMCITPGGVALLYTATTTNFVNLCGAIAARYGAEGTGQLQEYEIWNEPNNRAHYSPFGSSFGFAHYTTSILIPAATAIRAADSEAFIISAGLMSTADFAPNDILPSTFLQGIYDNGGKDYFDAVGYHWYSGLPDFSGMEEPTREQYFYVDLEATRAVMVAEGDANKDIHITEMGFPITLDPNVRASWLAKQIELMADLDYVHTWYIYNFRPGVEAESDPDSQFGTVDFDFTPKLPYYNYIASINAVVPAAFTNPLGGAMEAAVYDPTGVGGDAFARANHTGSQLASTISNFSEAVDDRVAALVAEGSGIDFSYNDAGNTLTVTATGGGGGGGGTPPYVALLDAVSGTADETFDVAHSLDSLNVEASIRRSFLMDDGLSGLERGESLGPFKWWVLDQDTIRVNLDIPAVADELIITVADKGEGGDITDPTVGTLTSPSQTTTTISLSLSGSTDDDAVVGVEWEREISSVWTNIATTEATTYTDTSLPTDTDQTYRARVFDLFGRRSSYSSTINPSTDAAAAVVLDTVGAGAKVIGTTTISTSQVVTPGSGNHIVVYLMMSYGNWYGSTDSEWSTMTLTSNQGVASAPGTPVALTRKESQIINPGNPTSVIHLYELDNPATATHSIALGSVPGAIGTAGQFILFSASYHNVAAMDNIVSGYVNSLSALNQNVTAGTDSMAIMGAHFHPVSPITGFSKTQRDNDGGSPQNAAVFGDAPGESDNSVNFQTTTAEWHAWIGARLLTL